MTPEDTDEKDVLLSLLCPPAAWYPSSQNWGSFRAVGRESETARPYSLNRSFGLLRAFERKSWRRRTRPAVMRSCSAASWNRMTAATASR